MRRVSDDGLRGLVDGSERAEVAWSLDLALAAPQCWALTPTRAMVTSHLRARHVAAMLPFRGFVFSFVVMGLDVGCIVLWAVAFATPREGSGELPLMAPSSDSLHRRPVKGTRRRDLENTQQTLLDRTRASSTV